jgi:hypothetical protein
VEAEAASASSRRPSGKVRVGDQPQRHGRIVLRQPETELIYRHTWTSRHDAELAIFAWIEGWYNTRTHSSPHWACAAQTNTKQRSTLTPPTSTPPSKLETSN